MSLSQDLAWRGLIKDKTFSSIEWLDKPKTFYWGVDCSSDSLTIGNLAPLLLARRMAEAGWQAVLLVGGATSLIGDPGGKDQERPLLPRETVEKNVRSIKGQVTHLFAGHKFQLVDNYEWFNDVKYLVFLRDIGKHFSITELIQRDFVSERIGKEGSGISYAEFSYSLIQGYDYLQLYDKNKTVLQIGGSDQWGNMLSGVGLIRKKNNAEVHALSMPLVINKASGKKFGKSEEGAVWLDAAKTSPSQMYQFWINVDDADVEDYLKIYTFLNREQIGKLMASHAETPHLRLAQTRLAREITELVHGHEAAKFAASIASYLTGEAPIHAASTEQIKEVKEVLPCMSIHPGSSVIDVLIDSGLAPSKSEARRLTASKAIYINNNQLTKDHLEAGDFKNGRLILRRGKAYKDSALVELKN